MGEGQDGGDVAAVSLSILLLVFLTFLPLLHPLLFPEPFGSGQVLSRQGRGKEQKLF